MCGIVGLMGYGPRGLNGWNYKVFENLLWADASRGMHGTGMYAVDMDSIVSRVKVGGPPSQLFNTKEYGDVKNFCSSNDVRFLVGHNRYATKGAKDTKSAHPFKDRHIVLVHNGTLENYRHLPNHKDYEVDSELLCHSIAEKGIDWTIKDLEGAWTLVYWDGKEKSLNILRNDQRPLYMAWHEDEKMFAFASEKEMLEWCMGRNGYYKFDIEEVPADHLMTFPLDGKIDADLKIMKPTIRELKGKKVFRKKSQSYIELFAEYDSVTDNTGEEAAAEVPEAKKSIVVYKGHGSGTGTGTGSSNQGEWKRGKTGQVATNSTSREGKRNWTAAEHLHDLSKGLWVTAQITDYDLLEGTSDMYKFICQIKNYPDIEFICHVKGEAAATAVADATYGVRAQVQHIMKSTLPPAVNPHRIYLHNPEPAFVQEPEVPNHAFH